MSWLRHGNLTARNPKLARLLTLQHEGGIPRTSEAALESTEHGMPVTSWRSCRPQEPVQIALSRLSRMALGPLRGHMVNSDSEVLA